MQTLQLRVTLPSQLQTYLQAKADKFGLSMSSYVRTLIINDVKNDYPVRSATLAEEKAYQKALKERPQAIKIHNIDAQFKNL